MARSVLEAGVMSPVATPTVVQSPRVGCSGWNYKSWRGRFYPRELPVARWLEFYVARLFSSVRGLGRQSGPVLYQLPGSLTIDLPRLDRFLSVLPRGSTRLHAVEFRDPSWYVAETYELLATRRVALCLHDKLGSEIREPFVGPFVYVRFHGTSGRYHGSYSRRQLDRWAHVLAEWTHAGRRVFAYFNNDPDAVATANALTLREMIQKII
jgi:uncharacterized protein YecE (DUF72 family)